MTVESPYSYSMKGKAGDPVLRMGPGPRLGGVVLQEISLGTLA